jgi:NAD(P)H-dependent flavin oxidoreductase YrpB (nitropropane dioxygenase family)
VSLPTRFTRLVGCRLPIRLAGMPRTSVPDLVAAVMNAGGLGMFGGAHSAPEQLAADLDGLARSIAAGAGAVPCRTVFVAAEESGAHDAYRRALVADASADTVITTAFGYGWPDAPRRVLRGCMAHSPMRPRWSALFVSTASRCPGPAAPRPTRRGAPAA